MILLLGCLSFLLFVLGDLNSVNWGVRALRPCFFAGCLLLAGSTAALLITARPRFLLPAPLRGLAGFLGALFLLLLVYSLFFALPFQQTYLEEAAERRAYDRGVYALCRHPGVLWFILFYLCCWLVRGSDALFWAWVLFSLLNVGYIVLQDLYIFPRTFGNYGEYRKTTPFLIPNRASMRRCAAPIKAGEEHGREL